MGKADSRPAYGGQGSEDALPEAWEEVRAGEVLGLFNGFPFKPSDWGTVGLPIIRIQNLNNPKAPFNHYSGELASRFRVERGDLLFAWSGTPGTSFGAHIWEGGSAWLNQHIFRVEFDEARIDKRFLRFAINRNLESYIAEAHGGVGLAHITKGRFEDGLLVLPPIAEQRRIVAKVEALLARVNATRDRLARVPAILKRFRQSVLAAACSGRLTEAWRRGSANRSATELLQRIAALRRNNDSSAGGRGTRPRRGRKALTTAIEPLTKQSGELPEAWVWVRFGDVIGELRNGIPAKPNIDPPGLPLLRISSVRPGHVDVRECRYLPSRKAPVEVYRLRDGDLLFTRYNGSLDLLGICGMVRSLGDATLLYPDKLMRVRFDHDCVLPGYAELFFASADARDRMTGESKSSAGQQGVSGADTKRQPFALPPLEEQHEIVRRVETLFALADTIEQRAATALRRADRVTQSILSKAFRGELVSVTATVEGTGPDPWGVCDNG